MTEYPHEDEAHLRLSEWAAWRNGGASTLKSIAFDEAVIVQQEARADDFRMPVVAREAEVTDRALVQLQAQSMQQYKALVFYHFRSTARRAVAKAAALREQSIVETLAHAHDNFHVLRREISIHAAH